MITLEKEPEDYSGVNNPIWLKATTDNIWAVTGVKNSQQHAIAVGSLLDGDYFEYVVQGVAYRFTFVAGAAGDNEISLTGITGFIIADAISASRDLGLWFSILFLPGIPDFIQFDARDYGVKYNIDIYFNGGAVGGAGTGVDWERKPGFRMLMDVFMNAETGTIGTYEPIPDTDYTDVWANFYIENVLKPYLFSQAPKAGNTGLMTTNRTVRKYWAKIYEKTFGTNAINYNGLTEVDERWAFAGGTDWDKWGRDKADISTDFFSTNSGRRFLSLKPKNSYIHRTEEQYVYFWCRKESGANASLNATWQVYYKDGTFEIKPLVYAAVENEVAIVPAWLDAITGLAQDADNIVRVRLVLGYAMGGGGDVSSEAWVWDVMPETMFGKNVQIKNSMGGYDSWMMTGGTDQQKITEATVSSAPIADGYFDEKAEPLPAVMGTDTRQRIEQNKVMKLSSGWMNRAHVEWMVNELGSSILILDGNQWVEWRISDKNVGNVVDGAGMQQVNITIEEAFVSNRN
jgi:hypothetical protein